MLYLFLVYLLASAANNRQQVVRGKRLVFLVCCLCIGCALYVR